MTVEELQKLKKASGYTNTMIAELSGVPLATVQKIFAGVTSSPRYETLLALEKIFQLSAADRVSDSGSIYGRKKQYKKKNLYDEKKEYRIEDYYAWPEDERIELIDGKICHMEAPSILHQSVVVELTTEFRNYIRSKDGECRVLVSPVDVQLDQDDKTMVQPDIAILCDRDKLNGRCVYGAPDMVIEVLSRSTKKKDMLWKASKYVGAGVKEYWMVDVDTKRVLVCESETDELLTIYGFGDKIPVGIYEGDCIIDFSKIYEYVHFLYESKDSNAPLDVE